MNQHEQLYNHTCMEVSRLITERYSTSFTLGIKTLHRRFHAPIYAIYGFVRFADEIVDTFHAHDKAQLLDKFREDTYAAIHQRVSFNPVLHSFQQVVHQYGIEKAHIDAFLHSMAMDLTQEHYDQQGYREYIWGSADVVGLMCLRVFTEGDEKRYQMLEPAAIALGSAFQKVNFLRDLRSDYYDRGRIYFPGTRFETFDQARKQEIEADIQANFDQAYEGIRQLPRGARLGVYLAYTYYLKLFQKIKQASPDTVRENRIRIPNSRKMSLMIATYFRNLLNLI